MINSRLFMVVALAAEAKPLIGYWNLKRRPDALPFAVFVSEDERHWLIQCGIGKISTAAAVGYLGQFAQARRCDAWLNVGIAGSGSHALGSLVVGHKVTDWASQRSWYPSQLFQGPRLRLCQTAAVRTVDRPQEEYPAQTVIEMEASGFCGAAIKFATNELVQIVKVISDTPHDSLTQITKERVVAWIEAQMDTIDSVGNELLALGDEVLSLEAEPQYYGELMEQIRFSVTQSHQLRKLLARWEVLLPDQNPLLSISLDGGAKTILNKMKAMLDASPVDFEQPLTGKAVNS